MLRMEKSFNNEQRRKRVQEVMAEVNYKLTLN